MPCIIAVSICVSSVWCSGLLCLHLVAIVKDRLYSTKSGREFSFPFCIGGRVVLVLLCFVWGAHLVVAIGV